jgi:hypothetical protein
MVTDTSTECNQSGGVTGGSAWLDESTQPVIWLGYPGESPVIDMGGPSSWVCFEPTGDNIYLADIEIANCTNQCVQVHRENRYGAHFWRVTFDGYGPGQAGGNPAAIMYGQLYGGGGVPNTQAYYDVVSNCTFQNGVTQNASGLRMYSWLRGLVADNAFASLVANEAMAVKSDDSETYIRGNTFTDITGSAIYGNNAQVQDQTYVEVSHNNCISVTGYCLVINQNSLLGVSYYYRNTFNGGIWLRNTDSSDGPFYLTDNVIVNSQAANGSCPAKVNCEGVTDYTRLVLTDNLTGVSGDSITDSNGLLQGSYRTSWLGTRGWELGGDTRRFSPRLNLIRSSLPQHTEELN